MNNEPVTVRDLAEFIITHDYPKRVYISGESFAGLWRMGKQSGLSRCFREGVGQTLWLFQTAILVTSCPRGGIMTKPAPKGIKWEGE
jgi:hypothetical protein